MISPLDISRYFILRAYEDGREALMTNMKAQKLLYYSQSLALALFEIPLFAEEIQAWHYGPVCPPAYRFYSEFEANQLPIPSRDELTKFPEEIQNLLDEVWDYFGEHHAYYLSGQAHLEFPWKKARRGLPENAPSREPILLHDMKTLGEQKLEEIERDHPVFQKVVPILLKETFTENIDRTYVKQGEVHNWLNSLLA